MDPILPSIRVAVVSRLICVGGYVAAIWGVGVVIAPTTAQGSLITSSDGKIVGSSLVAQKFTEPRYFWPRPSAVDYDGAGAGGSNKSPTSTDLTDPGGALVAQFGANAANPLPPELAAASGSGLDPNISEVAALYQAPRVAGARNIPRARIEALIQAQANSPGGFLMPGRLVNVLELNLALDRLGKGG
jgi:K+-transporting ATPase ATPase C chain